MPERTIDWGGANSPYETHVDRDNNGRVVLAEDTSGNTVLLEYDEGAGEWVYGGPVNMDGADVSNVGTLDANAIDTGEATINNVVGKASLTGSDQSIPSGTAELLDLDTIEIEDDSVVDVDTANSKFVIQRAGTYTVKPVITWARDSSFSSGDNIFYSVFVDGISVSVPSFQHVGGVSKLTMSAPVDISVSTGAEITVTVNHNSGQNEAVAAVDSQTYVSITRVG